MKKSFKKKGNLLRSVKISKISAEENKGTKQMNFLFSISNSFPSFVFPIFFFSCLPSVSVGCVSNFGFLPRVFGFVSPSNPFTFLIFLFSVFTVVFFDQCFLCFSSVIFSHKIKNKKYNIVGL